MQMTDEQFSSRNKTGLQKKKERQWSKAYKPQTTICSLTRGPPRFAITSARRKRLKTTPNHAASFDLAASLSLLRLGMLTTHYNWKRRKRTTNETSVSPIFDHFHPRFFHLCSFDRSQIIIRPFENVPLDIPSAITAPWKCDEFAGFVDGI